MATLGLGTSTRSSPGKACLHAAVEEVRDVGVLLGLGDVELAPAELREDLGQAGDESAAGRRPRPAAPSSYSVIVTTSRSRGRRPRSKPVEVVAVDQRVDQLARAVGAEVEVDDDVAVAHGAVDAVDDRRRDELVVLAARVAVEHGLLARWRDCRPLAVDDRLVVARSTRSQRLSRSMP